MRRTIATACAGLAATAGVIGVTTASSASGSTTQTFTLIGHQTAFHVVDTAPKGDSAGDVGTLKGTLSRDGKRVGRYLGECTQFDGHGDSVCQFVFALSDGQIVLEAAYGKGLNGDRTVHDSILGGTGAYAGASGYGVGRETGRTTLKETLHIQS